MQKTHSELLRKMVVTAIFGVVGFILMVLEFPVPLVPSFIKLDFSELPALITAFAVGPLWGVIVCLVKNVLHCFLSSTMGIGELSNFILGSVFVFAAGLVYKYKKSRIGALIGSVTGAVLMSVIGVFSNYFIIYPLYSMFLMMPMDTIINAYHNIYPFVTDLWTALLVCNLPFTFLKCMVSVVITFICYKYLSPIIKGEKKQTAKK